MSNSEDPDQLAMVTLDAFWSSVSYSGTHLALTCTLYFWSFSSCNIWSGSTLFATHTHQQVVKWTSMVRSKLCLNTKGKHRRISNKYTVDSRYLEVQGTLSNTSWFPYLYISYLQNWGKNKSNNRLLKLEIYWKYCGKEEKLLLISPLFYNIL